MGSPSGSIREDGRSGAVTECIACLEPAGRKCFRGLPVCKLCDYDGRAPKSELDSYEAELRQRAARKAELSPAARLKSWPAETCPIAGGVPYALLGPPRRVGGSCGWDEEIARQNRLLEAGLLRRGWYRDGSGRVRPVTLGWEQYHGGRFAWHGYDSYGIALYSGAPTGQVGGSWPSPDDYLRAWEAGQDDSFPGGLDPRGSRHSRDRSPAASGVFTPFADPFDDIVALLETL